MQPSVNPNLPASARPTAALIDPATGSPRVPLAGMPPRNLLRMLCQLRDRASTVMLTGPSGASLRASLWTVDGPGDGLSFDVHAGDPQLPGLVEANEATALCYLDAKVLQFELQDLVLVRNPRACALWARLPRRIHRFARPDAACALAPTIHAPCVRLRHPLLPEMALALRVIDLSLAGGLLLLPDKVPALPLDVTLSGAQLWLEAGVEVSLALRLEHASSLASGTPGLRLGCEWLGLTPSDKRRLQHHIDRTQQLAPALA